MARKQRLTKKQLSLLSFLRDRSGEKVTQAEILATTGWKETSWKVYLNNGLYGPYLSPIDDETYVVTLDSAVTDQDFHRQITQSVSRKALTSHLRYRLARALVARSHDNMILALEAYNRPSLENRLDAFAMLFCTAWEQLLKADIIEKNDEQEIFRPPKANKRRETISLAQCLEKLYKPDDPVRKNIERISELRHAATHLLMPELQPPLPWRSKRV